MLERVLKVLEYPKIKEHLMGNVASSLGKEKVEQLQPVFEYESVKHMQEATFEAVTVIRLKGKAPLGGIHDIRPSIKRAAIGGMLNASELLDIANTIYGGRQIKQFLEALYEEQELPHLEQLTEQISLLKSVEQSIKLCIDEHGDVLDSASSSLRTIRAQIRTAESRVKEQLNKIVKSSSTQKMLQESIVTIRNDRYCIPVKSEYRSHFGGMVHDSSASGATLFIEPKAVVAINNQLREAKAKEEQEIERILRSLTEKIAEVTDPLARNVSALSELDFVFAKAYYGIKLKAVQPKLNDKGYFHLKQARHPLIPEEEIVPISFELGDEYTSLVITGPNTGGKTVTLKTLGLLTLMSCSGLFVPADEGTEMAVVSNVFADIGDEQSIEQSLSTFSSHMTNIVQILRRMDDKSLVLFDELGAGTDPTEGAALAMAILDDVYQRGARVVATTHYSELKAYAYTKEGVLNASVEFNVETLQPTYRLLVGVPGRSNAFYIAQRLGLSEDIINRARGQVGEDDMRVETMIAKLEENQKLAEREHKEAAQLRIDVEKLRRSLRQKEEQLEREKEKRVALAEEEAKKRMEDSLKEAETIIKELRELSQKSEHVKDHVLIEAKKKLESINDSTASQKRHKSKAKKVADQQFNPGDEVYVHTFGQKGHIVEKASNNEFIVQLGIMKMKVEKNQMEKVKRTQQDVKPTTTIKTKGAAVKTELDLRGKTADEALMEVDKYLDDALLAHYHQVSLIHGKGTGQLRKSVHDYLRKHPRVKSYRLGEVGEGGSGATVVQIG